MSTTFSFYWFVICSAAAARLYWENSAGNFNANNCHFAAWEQPDIFARELRMAFRRLRAS